MVAVTWSQVRRRILICKACGKHRLSWKLSFLCMLATGFLIRDSAAHLVSKSRITPPNQILKNSCFGIDRILYDTLKLPFIDPRFPLWKYEGVLCKRVQVTLVGEKCRAVLLLLHTSPDARWLCLGSVAWKVVWIPHGAKGNSEINQSPWKKATSFLQARGPREFYPESSKSVWSLSL